jgi:hypothetical protein
MTILIIAAALIGLLLWLILRLLIRKSLRAETARLKTKIEKLVIRQKTKQTTLIPFMYDRYPYERHWHPEDWELDEYGESTAELDLQDEEDSEAL